MLSHSEFIFPTSFVLPSLTGATSASSTTMFGQVPPINPMVEIARIKGVQAKIFNAEAALFGVLFLFACCMMRPPKAKRKFYNENEDSDEEEEGSEAS
jgi:hypothetical protein